jgi:hypothetical protein
MSIWNWLTQRRHTTPLVEISQRAVALAVVSVRPLVEQRIASMGINEARGYVRARTGHLLQEAIDIVEAHESPASRFSRDTVFSTVLEDTLRLLYRRTSAINQKRRAA